MNVSVDNGFSSRISSWHPVTFPARLPEIHEVIMLSYRKRKESEHQQRMYTGNIPQIGPPFECRHASNSSIDGKPFPTFLLYSHLYGKIFKLY